MNDRLNVDYILTLKKNDENILYSENVEIPYDQDAKDVLSKLESYRNSSCHDVFDVIKYVSKLNFDKGKTYSYCWPHTYRDAFIRHASVQPFLFLSNSHRLIRIDQEYDLKKAYGEEMNAIRSRIEIEYSSNRPKRWMERDDYLAHLNKMEKKMNEEIEQKQQETRIEIRNNYIDEICRYIYAKYYTKYIPVVKESSLMYSNEIIGWYRPDYKIADNVLVSVRSNFCYGRSAHFHVNLNYKGINILPYTDIIEYLWSNMMDNVRYTKDYVPARYNWENALSFVAEVSNLITTDSERFEREWIIERVEKMMDGLKSINEDIAKYYEKQKEAKEKEDEEEKKAEKENREIKKIIRYRFVDDLTIKRHKVYENEVLLTIQVDKLSAALSLLDDLTAIQNIYSPILTHIDTIVDYNAKIVPAIDLCHSDLQGRIDGLNIQLSDLQKQSDDVQSELLAIRNEIDKRLEETNETYQQLSAENINKKNMLKNECEKNEEYLILQNKLPILIDKIKNVQTEIKDRESFDKHLTERKEFIEGILKERGNVKISVL